MKRTITTVLLVIGVGSASAYVALQLDSNEAAAKQNGDAAPGKKAPDLADGSCLADASGAKYRVIERSAAEGATAESRSIVLWRDGAIVAHEDPQKGVTELWNRTPRGQLRLVRAFDAEKRSVNYEPADINGGRGERDWSVKWQLVSDALLQAMTVEKESGSGCDRVQHLKKTLKEGQLEVDWMPARKLMSRYHFQSEAGGITWELDRMGSPEKAKSAVARRLGYQDTDYADIGDNESDPFFRRMINLGFIEHGASGVYDSQGHSMSGGHDHQAH